MKVSPRAALATMGISILWGGNIVSMKIALAGLSPMMMAGIRFSLGALVIFLWIRVNHISVRVSKSELGDHFINGLLFGIQITLFYIGTNLTSASHAVILINSNIIFLAILAHFFITGDRLNLIKVIGLILAFMGVSSLFFESSVAPRESSAFGDLLVVMSAMILGIKTVFVKQLTERVLPSKVVLWQMLIGVPVFFLIAYGFEDIRMEPLSIRILTALAYQGIVVAGFCFVAATFLIKHYSPTAISVFFFVIPVSGVALSHWILAEAITKNIAVGTVLVASGIVLVNLKEKVVVELDKP